MKIHENYINRCIEIAKNGLGTTFPNPMVGCVIVHENIIIGEGFTSPFGGNHAEVNAIRSVTNKELLKKSTLYVTLEPCNMCAGALFWSQIGRVVFGAADEKRGFMIQGKHMLHPKTKLEFGVLHNECSALVSDFFNAIRMK